MKCWYRFRGLLLLVVAEMERTDTHTHTHTHETSTVTLAAHARGLIRCQCTDFVISFVVGKKAISYIALYFNSMMHEVGQCGEFLEI